MKLCSRRVILFVVLASVVPALGVALIMTRDRGAWPSSWPKELEAYRPQAKTVEVAHGKQERHFEIEFQSREEFEKAWPAFLKVKSRGGVLILSNAPSRSGASGSTMGAGLRIMAPVSATQGGRLGETTTGVESPEYAVRTKDGEWVPFDGSNRIGFMYRARVDIELVVDGKTVDLNRIPLPPDTMIYDRRTLPGTLAESPDADE